MEASGYAELTFIANWVRSFLFSSLDCGWYVLVLSFVSNNSFTGRSSGTVVFTWSILFGALFVLLSLSKSRAY